MNASENDGVQHSDFSDNPFEPATSASEAEPRRHPHASRLLGHDVSTPSISSDVRSSATMPDDSLTARMHRYDSKDQNPLSNGKTGIPARPAAAAAAAAAAVEKLGTFAGVFVPTSLNVFSVLMFLRFGFILGQAGILGALGMLVASYVINLVTILSLSAVATNGTVRGGGAYYLISRSLGPEFGGSIGVVFYLTQVFNTGMNAVGLIDCVKQNFGSETGNWGSWLDEGYWWQYLWGTIVVVVCTIVCCGGSGLFARASNGLLFILLLSTFSIPFSALVRSPFEAPELGISYTGLSWKTFRQNLLPHLTRGAAGSQLKGRESFQDLFGILYPSTSGIFAGASMSGSLKHPSKAIPKGTLYGIGMTFIAYTLVILAMGATITRETLYKNVNVVQDTVLSGILILAGEVSSSFFSTLMGVIGAADLLQALARDAILPGTKPFAQGYGSQDVPLWGILLTFILTQLVLFGDINQIAVLVTMGYLMTFLVMNLACFLLKIGSAPNFRPSFRYFNWYTALFGTLVCGASMFFVDGWSASGCVVLLILVFLLIHYTTPPKSWGDVSQSLIYHQVRKYLLRLKTEHVKFWRPQILLFVNDPRRSYKLIQFCNSLKKGGLFVLGHVIVTPDFDVNIWEARKQQQKWNKYIDLSRIKAFIQIVISPSTEWGTRNLVLSAGLGGMRPNVVIMGFYNLKLYYRARPLVDVKDPEATPENEDNDIGVPHGQQLPTDDNRKEPDVSPGTYVTMLEDLMLRIQINVALARNFSALQLPQSKDRKGKKYIDLWPIQMSAEISAPGAESARNILTTNFDTYTLILQLGCILNTVPAWKKAYTLRVIVFVEYESDVEEERGRVQTLIDSLRIRAEVLVFWLASGRCKTYQAVVNGDMTGVDSKREDEIEKTLEDEAWWHDIQHLRGKRSEPPSADLSQLMSYTGSPTRSSIFRRGSNAGSNIDGLEGLRRVLQRAERRRSSNQLQNRRSSMSLVSTAPMMTITTHRLPEDMIHQHALQDSASEGEDSEDDTMSTTGGTEVGQDEYDNDAGPIAGGLRPARAINLPANEQLDSWSVRFRGSRRDKSPGEESVSPSRTAEDSLTERSTQSESVVPQLKHLVDEEQSRAEAESDMSTKGKHDRTESMSFKVRSQSDSLQVPRDTYSTADEESAITSATSSRPTTADSSAPRPRRPKPQRHASGTKFSSKPVPATKISAEDGPGPSIMFTESIERPDPSRPRRSIYERPSRPRRSGGGGGVDDNDDNNNDNNSSSNDADTTVTDDLLSQLSAQSAPLSFNDLPCRAQYLILNDLMRSTSAETAVLFTTLPSPAPGTGHSEDDSAGYLSDLEVLCQNLPPTLLVHSNSMTVTMNL